jgi:hypothetical protein
MAEVAERGAEYTSLSQDPTKSRAPLNGIVAGIIATGC